jgi:putative DNA primase/helicase
MEKPLGTEAHSAEVLSQLLRKRVLYVPEWGWMVWDGRHWLRDVYGIEPLELAYRVLSQYYNGCAERAATLQEQIEAYKAVERACSTLYVKRVLKLLKEQVLASPQEFDTYPHLLNCLNGVVDLRTGELLPHEPELRLTKLCLTDYDPNARSELWERFLEDVFLGDRELIAYMQRALGYSITGETREQKLFICWGKGANGKTTLFQIVREVWGGYAHSFLMIGLSRDRRSHKAEMWRGGLYGVRLATLLLTTLSEERRLGKVLPKLFDTGNTITARCWHSKPFNFTLQAKLWLSTNHKPRITDPDLLRRVVVIPFRAVFTTDPNVDPAVRRDPDPLIRVRLLQFPHRKAILAWLVEGAIAWYREGLQEPDIVRAAIEECWCKQRSKGC